MHLTKGYLITVEGIDGSGKSSLLANLTAYFNNTAIPYVLTKEPGGSELGKYIRTLLHDRPVPITAKAEYLLFASDRAQHFVDVIEPGLAQKKIVLSDRLADSSLVYQGYGRNLDLEKIRTINAWALNNAKPDLTLYVHIDATTALQRIMQRAEKLTAFEQEKRSFYEKLITGYTELYAHRTDVLILDGNKTQHTLTQEAIARIMTLIS
jgi:dTMP kinase